VDVTPLEAALQYLDFGWRPLAVEAKGKKPVDERGHHLKKWGNLRLTSQNIGRYFQRGQNVGVILGEPSEWLVDVDLDCPEAIRIADRFLRPTQSFGRSSRPRSHRLYVARGAMTKQFRDPKQNMIVELRSSGEDGKSFQTVFPWLCS
jgi:hypothetical protein